MIYILQKFQSFHFGVILIAYFHSDVEIIVEAKCLSSANAAKNTICSFSVIKKDYEIIKKNE